jgi:hypothetical protein
VCKCVGTYDELPLVASIKNWYCLIRVLNEDAWNDEYKTGHVAWLKIVVHFVYRH